MDTADKNLADNINKTGHVNNSGDNATQEKSQPSSPKHQPSWSSTGDRVKDNLKLFSTGSFYDCTFKVSNDETGEMKLFRCHKIFLATCSEVFDKMLFGSFKEANGDRDFEICFPNTSPEVFDLAMSYVYGGCSEFKSPELAMQVYFFARQWMIVHLTKAVEQYLIGIIDPENVLGILEHFVDDAENDVCVKSLDLIEELTGRVLKSDSWVTASKKVVLQVLRVTSLQIAEAKLFHYLVKWGRTGIKDDDEARSKIDDGLKLIKFCAMSRTAFSNLCCSPLPLSTEEKFKILLSINEQNPDLLPKGFAVEIWPRFLVNSFRKSVCLWSTFEATRCTVDHQTAPFTFKMTIDTPRYLTGLMLNSLTLTNAGERVQLICEVFSPEQANVPIGYTSFDDIVEEDCSGLLYMTWPALLHPGIQYSITLSYQHQIQRRTEIFNISESSEDDNIRVHLESVNDTTLDIFGLHLG